MRLGRSKLGTVVHTGRSRAPHAPDSRMGPERDRSTQGHSSTVGWRRTARRDGRRTSIPPRRQSMLAFNVFGTKEIIVYVIVIVIVIALIAWYAMRGRSRA